MFSIIIPTYNRANFISNAIGSVINQSYTDWELIIVDDGSTDNTKEIVESFNDSRIRYIYQENQERSAARNNGIRNAKGDWICFLDSDDIYFSNHLAVIDQAIKRNNRPRLILTQIQIEKLGTITLHEPINTNPQIILQDIMKKFILMNTTCAHKSIFNEHLFDRRFSIWEDTHLWLRIAATHATEQLLTISTQQTIHMNNSVVQQFSSVNYSKVIEYISAIDDLKDNYIHIFDEKISRKEFDNYKNEKLTMFLYSARQNRQFLISIKLAIKLMKLNPSTLPIVEVFKAIFNKFGFKIHGK